jgi:hypothetical protein
MVGREESERAAHALPKGKFQLLEATPHPMEKVDIEVLQAVLRIFFRA